MWEDFVKADDVGQLIKEGDHEAGATARDTGDGEVGVCGGHWFFGVVWVNRRGGRYQ